MFAAPCYGATVEETEQDQDENDIEDFVAFSIKGLEGFAILDGGATKTVSGFRSIQPVADQYEDTTIETTDVGFTFTGGETEAASTNICIPHAGFPQGNSVNVVSNESTHFLIGLDVLREYGLVIDCHYKRVHNHILKRYLRCAILPTRNLALENDAEQQRIGQRPVSSQALSTWSLTPTFNGTGERIAHFIFMKRSPDTLLSGAMMSIGGRAMQYSHWNGFDLTTKAGTDKLKKDLLEKNPRDVWITPPCTTQRTQQSQPITRFHRI